MNAEVVIFGCATMLLAVVVVSLVGWFSMRPLTPDVLLARLDHDLSELQDDFLAAGRRAGKPRGLHWGSCTWTEERVLARDRASREVVALVAVVVHGADGEQARSASAVFFFAAGRWQTAGKALFNLRPTEVLNRLAAQYEPLASS